MRWYVLQVMSGKEIQVVDQLRLLGIHALAPIEDRIIRQKGSWITKAYVLFSSYVFVECDFDADTWFKVNSLSSVIRWLGDSKEPTPISYLEAEWIRMLGACGEHLQPSEVIVHTDGTYEVLNGILLKFKSKVKKWNIRQRSCEIYSPIEAVGDKTIKLSVHYIDVGSERTVDSSCDLDPTDINN